MRYYYPDYFEDFRCVGGKECPDSCCHIWQIIVDKDTLKKYKKVEGPLGERMSSKIDFKTGCIKQHGDENRCEFLNDNNLCDIVLGLGEDYLSNTCHTHPRHEEAYDNVRERSLAITCPIACKQLLERKEPVRIDYKDIDAPVEHDKNFDKPLFDQLLFVRDNILSLLQDRDNCAAHRMTLALGMSHDIERRIRHRAARKKNGLLQKFVPSFPEFSLDEKEAIKRITEEYQKTGAYEHMLSHVTKDAENEKIILNTKSDSKLKIMNDILFTLSTMEPLKQTWIPYLQSTLNIREQMDVEEYNSNQKEFETVISQIQLEQLMFYFTYVYCCSATYDEALLAKIKMAVVNTLIIRELWFMTWLENDKILSIDDQVEMAHWFVREVENSDENMEQWDSLMQRNPRFSLNNILFVLKNI